MKLYNVLFYFVCYWQFFYDILYKCKQHTVTSTNVCDRAKKVTEGGKGVAGFDGWGPVISVDASLSSARASEDSGPRLWNTQGRCVQRLQAQ